MDKVRDDILVFPQDDAAVELRVASEQAVELVRNMRNPAILTHVDTDGFTSVMALARSLGLGFDHLYLVDTGDKCLTDEQAAVFQERSTGVDGVIILDSAPTNSVKLASQVGSLEVPVVNIDHHSPVETPGVIRVNANESLSGDGPSWYTTIKIVSDLFGLKEEDMWLLQMGIFGDAKGAYWEDSVLRDASDETMADYLEIARLLNTVGTVYLSGEMKGAATADQRRYRLFSLIQDAQSAEELKEAILGSSEFRNLYNAILIDIYEQLLKLEDEIARTATPFFVYEIDSLVGADIIETFLKSTSEVLAQYPDPERFMLLVQRRGEFTEMRGYCEDPRVSCGEIFTRDELDGGGRANAGGGRCRTKDLPQWVEWIQKEVERLKGLV